MHIKPPTHLVLCALFALTSGALVGTTWILVPTLYKAVYLLEGVFFFLVCVLLYACVSADKRSNR